MRAKVAMAATAIATISSIELTAVCTCGLLNIQTRLLMPLNLMALLSTNQCLKESGELRCGRINPATCITKRSGAGQAGAGCYRDSGVPTSHSSNREIADGEIPAGKVA